MTSLRIAVVAAVGLSAGCQAEDFERVVYEGDHVSFAALEGWSPSRDRGSLVFSGAAAGFDGATIVVRSVSVPERQRDQAYRAPERLVDATRIVLESLPDAYVVGPMADVHSTYRSARFSVSFRAKDSDARYEREHVVLIAPDQSQIVHVMHTAPVDRLSSSRSVFLDVVASMRQES